MRVERTSYLSSYEMTEQHSLAWTNWSPRANIPENIPTSSAYRIGAGTGEKDREERGGRERERNRD